MGKRYRRPWTLSESVLHAVICGDCELVFVRSKMARCLGCDIGDLCPKCRVTHVCKTEGFHEVPTPDDSPFRVFEEHTEMTDVIWEYWTPAHLRRLAGKAQIRRELVAAQQGDDT